MKVINKKVQLLTAMAEIFGFHFTEFSMELYLGSLENISDLDLERIITYGMKTRWKTFPKPFEILEIVTHSEEQKTAIACKKEFEEIMSVIRKLGRNGLVTLSEAGRNALRQIGGMNRIADATDDEMVWIRKEFESCYEIESDRIKIQSRNLRLLKND